MTEFRAERINQLWKSLARWSQAQFGTDAERGPIGPLKHLVKEANEAIAEPNDPVEYADCLLLILDAARRAKISLPDLIGEAERKLEICMARKWPRPVSDEPVFHTA